MSRSLRLGLLSTARINDAILAASAATDRADVVAVGSRDGARAQAYAREHGLERAHGSYDALLDDDEIDAVYISLPNALHHEWTMRSLAAGKHVLAEKPYSRRPEEVEEALELAERSRLVLTEAFMYRHHPQAAQVWNLVEEGAVGRVRIIRAAFGFTLDDLSDIRAQPGLDGGALMDVGCYCVSFARFLAGEPERVQGESIPGPTGVDMTFHGTLRFPGDVVAQFDCSFALQRYQRLDVVGDEGWLLVDTPWRSQGHGELLLRHLEHMRRFEVEDANAYVLQLENLADAVAGTAAPLVSGADMLGQARTIAALYLAAEEGRTIEL